VENFLGPGIAIRQLTTTGWAAFAERVLPAGSLVATFGGDTATVAQLVHVDPDRVSRTIQIDEDCFLVGPKIAEPGDFVNHSCAPNCGMRNATQVVTMREIAPGEELTFDYAMTDTAPYDEFACKCSTPQCRGAVRASDWTLPELRTRYAGWFAPHVSRRIVASERARHLRKSDVERLMVDYDDDPVRALTTALRIVTGRPHASWEKLIGLLSDKAALSTLETTSLDRLATEMNESRTVCLHHGIGPTSNQT